MSRSPELTAAIEAWRTRFETDPNVTYAQIGADVGRSDRVVRSHAHAAGWERPAELKAEMLRICSRRGNEKKSAMKSPIKNDAPAARREAARVEWETDPATTYKSIADKLGMTPMSIGSHAKRNGWRRSAAVRMQASVIASARRRENMLKAMAGGYIPNPSAARHAKSILAGKVDPAVPKENAKGRRYPCWDTRQKEKPYTPPQRYVSVFDYAAQMST